MKKENQNRFDKPQKEDTPPEPDSGSLQNRRRFLRSVGHTTAAIAGISFVGGLFPRQALGCGECTDSYCSGTYECTGGTHTCSKDFKCENSNKCSATTFTCSDGNDCPKGNLCAGTFFNCNDDNVCGSTNTCTANFTCKDADHTCNGTDDCQWDYSH